MKKFIVINCLLGYLLGYLILNNTLIHFYLFHWQAQFVKRLTIARRSVIMYLKRYVLTRMSLYWWKKQMQIRWSYNKWQRLSNVQVIVSSVATLETPPYLLAHYRRQLEQLPSLCPLCHIIPEVGGKETKSRRKRRLPTHFDMLQVLAEWHWGVSVHWQTDGTFWIPDPFWNSRWPQPGSPLPVGRNLSGSGRI